MGKIYVKFDSTIKQSEIVVPLAETSVEEVGEANYSVNRSGMQQTSVYGVQIPIIQINSIVVAFNDIIYFKLENSDKLPRVTMEVQDRYNLLKNLDTPSSDNKLRVQILPPFDNAYKKINLTFYISSFRSIGSGRISIEGIYNCKELTQKQYKAFGKLSTAQLFEEVAKEAHLGFATNNEEIFHDERYMYCDFKTYQDLMNSELKRGVNDATHVFDWWVDWYNNINYVNVYERYNSIDKDEDMQVWVKSNLTRNLEGEEIQPVKMLAYINNNPLLGGSQLTAKSYEKVNEYGSQVFMGTDKVFTMYEMGCNECKSYLIQDGDVKKDINVQCTYLGEVYGDYNYKFAEACYDSYKQKMGLQTLRVVLGEPLLGLQRGDKVNFAWFINDSGAQFKKENLENAGLVDNNPRVIPAVQSDNPANGDGSFQEDTSTSGQYFISGTDIIYSNGNWQYILNLQRPASKQPNSLSEIIEEFKKNQNNVVKV